MTTWADGMVAANAINIHYYRTGGDKPAMLLLHGITDDGLCWTRVAHELQDRYDVVMMDARGHGLSDRPSGGFSVTDLAADAAGVIVGLRLQQPVVWGHSMGAITAAVLAAEHPELVKAVLLEDPPLRDGPMPSLPAEWMEQRRREFAALKAMTAEQRADVGARLNAGWHPLETGPWADSKTRVDLGVVGMFGSFDQYPWREALKRMTCPGLLITGNPEMAIVTPEVAAEAVELWPAGRVARIEGAGHNIRRDLWDETMRAVNAFLDTLEA